MATAYTSADYLGSAVVCRNALDKGIHVGSADLVKIIALLEDASANVAGITAIPADTIQDGTPAIPPAVGQDSG